MNMTIYNYRIQLMAKQIGGAVRRGAGQPRRFRSRLADQPGRGQEVLHRAVPRGQVAATGILWWNLRDGWPIISDAVVDYYFRKKLAYHYIKRVQADVCAICQEPEAGRHAVVVVNDTLAEAAGHVEVRDVDGGPGAVGVGLPCGGATGGRPWARFRRPSRPAMWLIEWTVDGRQFQNHYLAGPRPFKLADYKRWLGVMGLAAGHSEK